MNEERQEWKVDDEEDVEDDLADPTEVVGHQLVPVDEAVDAGCHVGDDNADDDAQAKGVLSWRV